MIFFEIYLTYMLVVFIGITLGYHRYFSHKEFEASAWQEVVMLSLGIVCGGRDPISWVGVHRMHHHFADTEKDPHGTGWTAFFSTWRVNSIPKKYVKDLYNNPRIVFFHRHKFALWFLSFIVMLPIWEFWVGIQVLSFFGFGMLNAFGHRDGKPVNNIFLNLIAPMEGAHAEHHKK